MAAAIFVLDTDRAQRFGATLERLRVSRGLSRNRLAGMAGVDGSYVTRVTRGQRNVPRLHIVEALARALMLSDLDRRAFFADAGYMENSSCCPRCADVADADLVLSRIGECGLSFLEHQLLRLLAERMPGFLAIDECCALTSTTRRTLQCRVSDIRQRLPSGWWVEHLRGEGYRLMQKGAP